jgi:hypothetical protein
MSENPGPTPLTEQELEELEGALRAASPAPWELDAPGSVVLRWEEKGDGRIARHVATAGEMADAAAMVAVRNAAPGLIDEVRRLRAAIRWALGEEGEFPGTAQGLGAFYWRRELRTRAFGAETARSE